MQSLVIIVMLAVFLELLLPSSTMQSYVKMVMGLLVLIAVLETVFAFIGTDFNMQVPEISATSLDTWEKIQADAEQLSEHYKNQSLEDYRQGISKQVLALANLNQQVKVTAAEVEVNTEEGESFGQLQMIKLVVQPQQTTSEGISTIPPVEIAVSEEEQPEKEIKLTKETMEAVEKMVATVADFYNLSHEQVQVIYQNGE